MVVWFTNLLTYMLNPVLNICRDNRGNKVVSLHWEQYVCKSCVHFPFETVSFAANIVCPWRCTLFFFVFKIPNPLRIFCTTLQNFISHQKPNPDNSTYGNKVEKYLFGGPVFLYSSALFLPSFLARAAAIQYFMDTCWQLFPHRNFGACCRIRSSSFWELW